jgi:hypothetical protein
MTLEQIKKINLLTALIDILTKGLSNIPQLSDGTLISPVEKVRRGLSDSQAAE